MTWSESPRGGLLCTFTLCYVFSHSFGFDELRLKVSDAVQKLQSAFNGLFPPGFIDMHLSEIQVSSFKDDEGSGSIFDGPSSAALLQPLQAELQSVLENEIRFKRITPQKIYQLSQVYLESLAVCLYNTTGTPLKRFQAINFRYAPNAEGHVRNFYLIGGSHGVFLKPRPFSISPQQAAEAIADNYIWLLPQQVAQMLLLYLGVFHPVELAFAS